MEFKWTAQNYLHAQGCALVWLSADHLPYRRGDAGSEVAIGESGTTKQGWGKLRLYKIL